MSGFEIRTEDKGPILNISMKGNLDENAKIENVKVNQCNKIVIDVAGVKMINSCGVRTWLLWTNSLPENMPVALHNCGHIFISSANIIRGFFPKNFEIVSARIPYSCLTCSKPTDVIHDKSKGTEIAEFIKCSHCGQQAEIDVIPEEYEALFSR